jgi:hypothetical protein
VSKSLFQGITDLLVNRMVPIDMNTYVFGINLTKHDSKIVSLFKFVLWKLINAARLFFPINKFFSSFILFLQKPV